MCRFEEDDMQLAIDRNGIWYHGSDQLFSELRANSTITPWRELAEAFRIGRAD